MTLKKGGMNEKIKSEVAGITIVDDCVTFPDGTKIYLRTECDSMMAWLKVHYVITVSF